MIKYQPILIDELIRDTNNKMEVDFLYLGVRLRAWKIAKPLNHKLNIRQRICHAIYVLQGKAIGVWYFEDMSYEDKKNHVKNNIKK